MTKWQPPALRHSVEEDGRVGWLELFFDLIYVAALIQLGDELASDVSWPGVVRFVGVFVLLWWVWTGTTTYMNRYAVDDVWHRMLVFFQMGAVGNFAIVAVGDVDSRSAWFVVTYILARIPLAVMMYRVRSRLPGAAPVTDPYLINIAVASAIWIVALAFPTPTRYWIWGMSLLIEFAIPVFVEKKRTDGPPLHEEHLSERYSLFTIIVLGETFVKTLSEVNEIGISFRTQVFGMLLFVVLVAMWWTYFDDVAESIVRQRSKLTGNSTANRVLWLYAHLPLALGLTAFGVASKKVIGVEAFGDALKANYSWLLAGALAAVLLAVALLDLVTVSPHYAVDEETRVLPRVIAAALILVAGLLLATGVLPALTGIIVITLIAVGQIAVEVVMALKADKIIEARIDEQLSAGADGCVDIARFDRLPDVGEAVCEICVANDKRWVQLRVCLSCGHVGCCDDTPGAHARAHYEETGHSVIATIENGDTWAYCFDHEATDETWRTRQSVGHEGH